MRIHGLIIHICVGVEGKLRVWRYLLPPEHEKDGHEIQGPRPVWQPVKQTDHLICATGNNKHIYVQRKNSLIIKDTTVIVPNSKVVVSAS